MKISAKYLTKVYKNGVYALDGFSAEIESGEFVAVLGESGSGKTTLLRLLSGLEKPTYGELYFDGTLFSDIPILKRDTAVVFQEYVLYPRMTVWENVQIALSRYNLTREEEDARIYKALCDLGLIKFRNQLPRVLSGGQKQRVALARAIVKNPQLLLFDEPLSNVAPDKRYEYINLIKELKLKLKDTTFIYVTHNPREAFSVGEKLLVMGNGKCLQYGDKEKLWHNPYFGEVLRLFGVEKEFKGSISNGVFQSDDFTLRFSDVNYNGNATLIYNPYNDDLPCLFDKDDKLIGGEGFYTFFDGEFDGKTLRFLGETINCTQDFIYRFIGKKGKVSVGVKTERIRFYQRYGDIRISVKSFENYIEANDNKYFLYYAKNAEGYIYINPSDIELFDGKRRLTAHYRVYNSSAEAKLSGKKLCLPCGKLPFKSDRQGAVKVSFNNKAYITPVKKGGLKATCIYEESIGDAKLVYCILKGFDNYVTFYSAPENKFYSSKLKIIINPEGIDFD